MKSGVRASCRRGRSDRDPYRAGGGCCEALRRQLRIERVGALFCRNQVGHDCFSSMAGALCLAPARRSGD
jgi:hypothetical protein